MEVHLGCVEVYLGCVGVECVIGTVPGTTSVQLMVCGGVPSVFATYHCYVEVFLVFVVV